MIKVLISCHVEPDRKSGDINYLSWFLNIIRQTKIPMVLTFMTGNNLKSKLLEYVSNHRLEIPANCPIGLHIHDEKIKEAFSYYQKYFSKIPEIISFGHWTATPERIKEAVNRGAKHDFSYSAKHQNDKYVFKPAFEYLGIYEVPVTCDPRFPYYPINPLNSHYHFLLTIILFFVFMPTNNLLHLYFHSYDLIEKKSALLKLRVLSFLFKNYEVALHN